MYDGVLNKELAKPIIDVDKILTLNQRRSHEEWVRNSLRARQDEFGTVLDLRDEADEAQEQPKEPCYISALCIGAGGHCGGNFGNLPSFPHTC